MRGAGSVNAGTTRLLVRCRGSRRCRGGEQGAGDREQSSASGAKPLRPDEGGAEARSSRRGDSSTGAERAMLRRSRTRQTAARGLGADEKRHGGRARNLARSRRRGRGEEERRRPALGLGDERRGNKDEGARGVARQVRAGSGGRLEVRRRRG